jgi:hypothetical protein
MHFSPSIYNILLFCKITVVNIIVTILHFREQCRNNLVTVSFITSGLNVNMLYWCFSYGTDDGILNVGWLHWKQLLKIQVD